MIGPIQPMPAMTDVLYAALKEDIRLHGILVPVEVDETGTVLDGYHRVQIAEALGIKDYPRIVRLGLSEADKEGHARRLNTLRRHLDSEQFKEQIRAVLIAAPQVSNLQIAKTFGISDKTVAKIRDDAVDVRNIPNVNDRLDTLGRRQPARKPRSVVSPIINTDRELAHYVQDAKAIAAASPELLEKVKAGTLTIPEAKKAVVAKRRAETGERGKTQEDPPSVVLLVKSIGDLTDADIATDSLDLIITDPPYPEEFLPLYSDLGRLAARTLKPGALLVVMAGQSFLPAVIQRLGEHLTYWWTACYALPGASTQLWQRKALCQWKPLLVYCKGEYKGEWFADVMRSPAPDKSAHEWGQSVEGMVSVLNQFAAPGMVLCDPFCGAGATAIAARAAHCSFIGIDIDAESINITRGRLNDTA